MKTDYIQLGDCSLLLQTLPDESIDLIVTSPPYDNLRDYKGYSFDFETIARQLIRVIKQGGIVVWIVSDATIDGNETGTSFRQALFFKDLGFKLHDTMIWKKDSCAFPEQVRYFQVFEYMFVFSKGKPKTHNLLQDRKNKFAGMNIHGTFRNKDGTTTNRGETWKTTICNDYGVRFNVWEQPSEKANRTGHPAVFPVQLATDHILSWSNKGDLVLDPFMVSGTTAIAAIDTKRHYIGFEISEEYLDIANKRIYEHTKQLTMFD